MLIINRLVFAGAFWKWTIIVVSFWQLFKYLLYVTKTLLVWEEMAVFFNISVPAWLNNCVGHFNHRYFFSYCLFMTLGCVYCSISGRNLFLDAYHALEVRPSLNLHSTTHYCCVCSLTCWVFVCLGLYFSDWHCLLFLSLTLGAGHGCCCCCSISAWNTWTWKSKVCQ